MDSAIHHKVTKAEFMEILSKHNWRRDDNWSGNSGQTFSVADSCGFKRIEIGIRYWVNREWRHYIRNTDT